MAAPEEVLRYSLRYCSELRAHGGGGSWRLVDLGPRHSQLACDWLKAQDVVDVSWFSSEAALTDQTRTRARFELVRLWRLERIGQI